MLMSDGLPFDLDLQEMDEELGAVVLKPPQLTPDRSDVYAKLLDHLPSCCVHEGFALEDLAAGELPQSAVTLALGTLAEEESFSVHYDSGHDVDHGCH